MERKKPRLGNENSSKTICIHSIDPDVSVEQIRQHFILFGEIKSYTIARNDDSRYVFIIFEDEHSAQTSAAKAIQQINGKSVKVYLNDEYSSFFNINFSLIPPDQESSSHILNRLPDECLLEIFACLMVEDLSNAADACTKFRAITKNIFTSKFSHVKESTINGMDQRTLARFLRNFGPRMKSFELNCRNMLHGSQTRYLELFCLHCAVSGNALDELKIMNFNAAHMNFLLPLQFLISSLKTLSLENCYGLTFSFGRRSNGRN